jgi:hypothetical protein
MTECDEVAAAMLFDYHTVLAGAPSTMDAARALVLKKMPDEGSVIRDNVAHSLHVMRYKQDAMLREAVEDARALVENWRAVGVIITIENKPLTPLAMRHSEPHIEVRLKR